MASQARHDLVAHKIYSLTRNVVPIPEQRKHGVLADRPRRNFSRQKLLTGFPIPKPSPLMPLPRQYQTPFLHKAMWTSGLRRFILTSDAKHYVKYDAYYLLCIMGTIGPIRDWRVDIGGGSYGLVQWNEGTSQVYVGKFFCHLPVSPPVATAGFLFFAFLVVIGLSQAVRWFKERVDSNA